MTKACRSQLDGLPLEQASHAGLLLTRYLKEHKPTNPDERSKLPETPEERVLERATKIASSDAYRNAFNRWRELIRRRGATTVTAQLVSSLAVGLGNESPLEVGLTVHHTYGMPIIPGSAIKGMCHRGASRWLQTCEEMERKRIQSGEITAEEFNRRVDEMKSQLKVIFGDTKSASKFVFWDAWYDPNSVYGKPFHRDVITVHHKKYYNKGSDWPTDFDDPNPVPFLVVRPHSEFLFAISAPSVEWGEYVQKLLKWCLENMGIGGKTNAGYGYFEPVQGAAQHPSTGAIEIGAMAKPTAPPGSIIAIVKNLGDKWIEVQIEGYEEVIRCAGLTPAGLGLRPGSIIFVEIKREKKSGQVVSAAYKGKPKE
jgi:CRISPR-associated protein Cmr6